MELPSFFRFTFVRRALFLLGMSAVHYFIFWWLMEGLLLAAVYSYFGAYGAVYGRRWVAVWAALLAVGFFVRGVAAVYLGILVWLVSLFLPLFWTGGGAGRRVLSWLTWLGGLVASQFVIALLSPPWRELVPHPFTHYLYPAGAAVPTPVDAPWYFLGYYVWERVHALYRGVPRTLRELIKPAAEGP